MQRPSADLKHVGVLIKLHKEKSDINEETSTLDGILLKSPKINMLS